MKPNPQQSQYLMMKMEKSIVRKGKKKNIEINLS
jgi:hypothetical protein